MLPAAYEVDHIVPVHLGGSDDSESNLHALCNNCHAEKTIRETIGRVYSESGSVKWCAACETYYSVHWPHKWHWDTLGTGLTS
jgi:hypothetical protein